MNKQRVLTTGVLVFVGFLLLIFLTSGTFVSIDSGERGVIFRPFSTGLDKENIFSPGFHVLAPWNTMYIYSVREYSQEEQMEVLSSSGLNIKMDVTVRVNPQYDKIGYLHETFGKDYLNSLVRPEVRSSVRKILGQFTEEELYSTKRDTVQQLIRADIENALKRNYIDLREALIRDITLPEKVKSAIENKLEAEQAALKYEFLLQQEELEAQRKITEARGKAEANRILNASLTANILTDKGIEATLELSKSPNSKIIVVGSGENGLPMILGGQ
ncbi:MAG: prohibitin family protein [Bacteroidia bacterium]|jgi:prohibitin 1|nr:prohibitin family protein [Bacteroidia bacterium]